MQHWKLTNKEFAGQIKSFCAACQAAGLKPTKRQASKWRRKCGMAFAMKGVKMA